jgi:hypothetical protein
MAERVVVRVISLNENLARSLAASGSTGNLRNQLESPFCRAKVREGKPGID